jgi:hypothetical protein
MSIEKIIDNNLGYHSRVIKRGVFGEFSKIVEEFEEAEDAFHQKNNVMTLLELSDLIGAIEEYVKKFNMSLEDLIKMKETTHRAFENGKRENRDGTKA